MANVLICDDALFVRGTLAKILENTEHRVVAQASNGVECIELAKAVHPDVILMDITMPDMDGIEATRQIVAMDPSIKIIMVSAMGQQEKVLNAITSGAKDFIVKPFEPSRILACIDKVMR